MWRRWPCGGRSACGSPTFRIFSFNSHCVLGIFIFDCEAPDMRTNRKVLAGFLAVLAFAAAKAQTTPSTTDAAPSMPKQLEELRDQTAAQQAEIEYLKKQIEELRQARQDENANPGSQTAGSASSSTAATEAATV